mgnify:FL=1
MKKLTLERNFVSFFVGLLFAVGLAIAGMTQPQKIIAFLDPWNWDASLLFVMVGAVGVHMLSYPLIRRRATPLLDTKWHVPTRRDITPSLLLGSSLFGVGWGLGGFCPGPALAALPAADLRTLLFVGSMLIGMWVYKMVGPHLRLRD